MPDWFLDEPAIDPIERVYLDAFVELSSCRSVGMDLGQIPWRDVVAYADRAGLRDPMTRVFTQVVRALDDAYLGWLREQRTTVEAQPPDDSDKART